MRNDKLVLSLFVTLIAFSLLSMVAFAVVDIAHNQCGVVNGNRCSVLTGDVGIISLAFFTPSLDAHADNYTENASSSGLNHHLCCDYNGTAPYVTSGYCEQQPLFTLWDLTNSHIGQNYSSGAPWRVCATSYDGFTQCDYNAGSGACNANQTLVGSLDTTSPWNSHYGDGSYLGTNICCSFNTSLTLQGVNIAQFDFWCGVQDGVCPEDYYNSTGSHPVCYPREDPDC